MSYLEPGSRLDSVNFRVCPHRYNPGTIRTEVNAGPKADLKTLGEYKILLRKPGTQTRFLCFSVRCHSTVPTGRAILVPVCLFTVSYLCTSKEYSQEHALCSPPAA